MQKKGSNVSTEHENNKILHCLFRRCICNFSNNTNTRKPIQISARENNDEGHKQPHITHPSYKNKTNSYKEIKTLRFKEKKCASMMLFVVFYSKKIKARDHQKTAKTRTTTSAPTLMRNECISDV